MDLRKCNLCRVIVRQAGENLSEPLDVQQPLFSVFQTEKATYKSLIRLPWQRSSFIISHTVDVFVSGIFSGEICSSMLQCARVWVRAYVCVCVRARARARVIPVLVRLTVFSLYQSHELIIISLIQIKRAGM